MKKGSRRKANHKRNSKAAIQRARKKRTNFRPNPLFGPLDGQHVRGLVNQAIGSALVTALDIDFIGMLQKMPDLPEAETETIQ